MIVSTPKAGKGRASGAHEERRKKSRVEVD
jgi:hypothetical protein